MDATQQIEDSFFGEEDESGDDDLAEEKSQREPLAVLKVLKNNHIPETEVPLYQGENILGRDPTSCSMPLQARSVSSHHAIISISVFGSNDRRGHSEDTEALLWDLGSLNGTRKGRLKLSPQVRYALTEGDSVVLADLPCQYVSLKNTKSNMHTSTGNKATCSSSSVSSTEEETAKRVENVKKRSALPPVPVWSDEVKRSETQTTQTTTETTLVPESDSDSDGEKHGRRERMRIVASDSVSSDLSSPTCSTFLTPANKIIPESEDESFITPSPALKGRCQKTVNDTEISSDSSKPDPLHFNLDSDTDVEDDVDMMKAKPAIEAAVIAEVAAVNPVDLHMDSDTDVEEEGMEKVKSDPEALGRAPANQDLVDPVAVNMDSDTDVEENGTDTVSLSEPTAALEEKKDALSSAQFHLESDTDEEVPHIQDSRPPSCHVAEFNMNSDTYVEEDKETTKEIESPCDTDSKHLEKQDNDFPDIRMFHHESDNDTDVEDDVTKIKTSTVDKETEACQTQTEIQTASEHSTDAQHSSPVRVQSPAEALPDEFRLNSDTDVEEDEDEAEEKALKCTEGALQTVQTSTPRGAGFSEEEKETQAFLSPSQLFKRPGLPSLLHPSISPGGVSHTDDDFSVAETQSFLCDAAQADATLDETPQSLDVPEAQPSDGASSFQLDLSDSSHQPAEAEQHDRDPGEEDWQLQATQLYAMKNSEGNTKAGQTQLDLDATQAYSESISQEEVGDGGKDEEDETQPLAALCHSSIHTAETQLIKHRAQYEDPIDRDSNEEAGASEPERKEEEEVTDEIQADSHLSTADTLLLIRSPRQEEHTQPYTFRTEKIQKEQEETESKDQEVQERDEGQRGQNEKNESVGQENDDMRNIKENERMVTERKSGDTRNPVEDEKKEKDENKKGEDYNEVDEAQLQPSEADTFIETLPMFEEEEEKGEGHEVYENDHSSSRGTQSAHVESTEHTEYDHHTHTDIAIAETLPMCEEEEGQEEEENELKNGSRPGRRRPKESVEFTRATVAETLPMCEEDNLIQAEEGQAEEGQAEEGQAEEGQAEEGRVEEGQAEKGQEQEGQPEEENEIKNSRRPGRRRPKEEAQRQSVKSDKVTHATIAETLPMCEEDNEGQEEEEEQPSEILSTKRSSMRRQNQKVKPTRPVKVHVSIPETLPMCDKEDGQEEKPQSEVKSVRKSHRRRQTSKVEATQRLEVDSTAEAMKIQVEDEEQDFRRSLRGKERGRAASGKGKGRGRAAAEKDMRGKRGKVEQDEDIEEEVDGRNKGRGKKNLRQKSKVDKTRLEVVEAENEEIEHLKKQEDEEEIERLQREKMEEEARDQLEREESIRLEKEREEREKREQEEKDRVERERIDREKEREKKEQFEREMKEKERSEREKQVEKERREQEEKDRLEQERMERENKEKEENEKLKKETRERQELEETIEHKKKVLAREKRENEKKEMKEEEENQGRKMEQKKKESKDNTEGIEKEKRQAPGRRKAETKGKRSKKEEEGELDEVTKERLESEHEQSKKQECEESSSKKQEDEQAERDSKPRRGRRTARKSLAPPASVEDEGGPAKRTRSRSNSSNSVCSEQSTQDSLSGGKRRGRRRTSTVPSSEKEDTKQAVHSRSNSRSSDRSSVSMGTPSRGRAAKKRKSGKAEEQEEMVEEEEEERKQSTAVGRGRGRSGKRPGANIIKAEAACEVEKEEEGLPLEDRVTSQSSGRGRKRGADVSTAETPQPNPKTPRRSLTGPTHKVLFTGVVDEDGEKVLVRLGGGLAKGVTDMTHLVTDKVRRTVKFLCAVARGVPIVTPEWLNKCGKAGSFLSPNGYLVKDAEQEKRFNFSLQDALRVASSQPLLQGYEIHVTPSVKPEPVQMKEIITCCGARFLPKMPSAHKAQTVVVSCEEDRALCERARNLSFPVVSAEFLLTGILQQKVDLQTHSLSPMSAAAAPKPNARTRGK